MTRRTNLLSAASMTTTEKLRRAQDLMRSIERSTKIKSNSTLADELVSLRLDLETIHNLDLIDIAGRWKVKKLVYGRPVDALINYWKNLKRPQKVQRTLKRKAPAAKVLQPQEAKKVKNEPKRKEFCVPVTTPSEPEIVPNQKFIIPKTVSEISNLLRGSWDVEINTKLVQSLLKMELDLPQANSLRVGVSVLKYKGLIDEEIAIEFIRKCVALKPLKVEDEMSPRSILVARRQAPTSKKEPSQGELTRQALEEIGMVISKPSATVSHQPEIPKLVDLNDELDVSDSSDDEGELDELLLREMKNLESGKSSSEESDSVEDEFDDEDDFLQDLLIKQLGQSTEKVGKSGSSTSHCHSDDLFDEIL